MAGTLFVVATPIGNLGDMVPRGIDILQTVDLIAAEDTRRSSQLLKQFNILTELISYHDHSSLGRIEQVVAVLERGDNVALISDAGTPLISDPGYRLVRRALDIGCTVSPVPGPCAAMAALSVAGLPSDRFVFEGFLPSRAGQRQKALMALAKEPRTLIFYEAPHRIQDTVADLCEIFGDDREAVLARELTKTYETIIAGPLADLYAQINSDANQQRGEIVLIVHGFSGAVLSDEDAEQERVLKILLVDLSVKQAANLAARITGGSKNKLYQQALMLSQTR
ncbi:MAG: 16S rRNA (cytidine(1402)-2'-O)-methyltransferase [Gammaproteobacteria bacterium]|nr:MAG: 16S rRNA (cytidine(1402)-2'-O)-methyltransferase [Gammaproteobacteria bacterium]RLA46545.1 MAG: 16S rRNA (cytidine(1402)-2'-O)-methyltransferase [Gammaproteobacteria bacterium]